MLDAHRKRFGFCERVVLFCAWHTRGGRGGMDGEELDVSVRQVEGLAGAR